MYKRQKGLEDGLWEVLDIVIVIVVLLIVAGVIELLPRVW